MNGDISASTPDFKWVPCDGRQIMRANYPELFSLIGTSFGNGDGINSYNIPDLRGRTIVGSGQAIGLKNRVVGEKGGSESVVLTNNEMPNHYHLQGSEALYNFYGGGDLVSSGGRTYPSGPINAYTYQFTSPEGGGQPHENMMPYLSIYALIRIK